MMNKQWEWQPLGELFKIGAGKTMSAAARSGSNKIPFLRTSNVYWDEIDLTQVDAMSISPDELSDKSLRPGDLLVCEGGEIGRAAIWNGEVEVMSFQNHIHRLRPTKPDVVPRFYVYFLQSGFTQLGLFEGAGNKTTIPNLSRNRLANLEVPYPPFPEQQAITSVLAQIRSAIELNALTAGAVSELKRTAMHELFTRGLRGEPQKETETGLSPANWRIGKLIDFAHFQRGFDITKTDQASGSVPVVSSGGIKSWHNKPAAKGPGVIIGRKGSIGSIYYVEDDYWPHDTTLWCDDFRGNSPPFVYYRLQVLDLKKLDSGATNPALNRNFLHDEVISWPDVEEQKQIASILQSIDRKGDLHQRKRAVLEELYKAVLHKLMTGETRVSDLDLSALQPAAKPGGVV